MERTALRSHRMDDECGSLSPLWEVTNLKASCSNERVEQIVLPLTLSIETLGYDELLNDASAFLASEC